MVSCGMNGKYRLCRSFSLKCGKRHATRTSPVSGRGRKIAFGGWPGTRSTPFTTSSSSITRFAPTQSCSGWTPGFGVTSRRRESRRHRVELSSFPHGRRARRSRSSAFPEHRVSYLRWAVKATSQAMLAREPSFGCLGLPSNGRWSYRDPNVRHPYVPLRLSREETDAVVDSQPLRCTHYDAFRFFTQAGGDPAEPLSTHSALPSVTASRPEARLHPREHGLVSLCVQDCSLLPVGCSRGRVRSGQRVGRAKVDMRASPYDL